jgi:signal transduction histidine kinase
MRIARAPVLLVSLVGVGVAGSLIVAVILGMNASEIAHLAALLIPAAVVTIMAVALAVPMLRGSSLRGRFIVVSLTATLIALANIVVLTSMMAVSRHDATLVGALLVYSAGAGIGAAWTVAGNSARTLETITAAAARLREGDLSARTGQTDGGSELERLASTFDAMAAAVQTATERERAVEAVRTDLISAVSHDLRTPLASLRAMIEAIDDGVVADRPTLERYAAEMRRSVGQLGTMVDDLFELVQIDAGAIEAEDTRARLEEVVGAALDTVRHDAGTKGLHLSADLGGAGDSACSPRVTRVLQTLLVNAVRHTPADGTIRVEARRSADALRLAVEDDGEGIPADDLPRVFEAFYRVDAARSGGGAGLGLALARRIVEALGGRIEARSARVRGARFEIVLPI